MYPNKITKTAFDNKPDYESRLRLRDGCTFISLCFLVLKHFPSQIFDLNFFGIFANCFGTKVPRLV